ncbi:MAG: helix-turn-helix transcriptional regulator [Patescibacteria group bacterium]|jgi:ribosome-binding protein aMBF1 (putative translation factor)
MKIKEKQTKIIEKAINLDDVLREELKNPKFKKYFDEYGRQLELSLQIIKLRQARKMSQLELAEKIGTTQGNVARIESGQQNFTVKLLDKVASALNSDLSIKFII